jgi:hypothetical protein
LERKAEIVTYPWRGKAALILAEAEYALSEFNFLDIILFRPEKSDVSEILTPFFKSQNIEIYSNFYNNDVQTQKNNDKNYSKNMAVILSEMDCNETFQIDLFRK